MRSPPSSRRRSPRCWRSRNAGAAQAAAGAPRAGAAGRSGCRRAPERAPASPRAAAQLRSRSQGGTGAPSYKIIPDERTNALILVAGPLADAQDQGPDRASRRPAAVRHRPHPRLLSEVRQRLRDRARAVRSDRRRQGGPGGLGAGLASPRPDRSDRASAAAASGSAAASAVWAASSAAAPAASGFGGGGFGGGGFGGGGFGGGGGFWAAAVRPVSLRGGGGGFGGGGLGRVASRRSPAAAAASSRARCASPPIPRPTR